MCVEAARGARRTRSPLFVVARHANGSTAGRLAVSLTPRAHLAQAGHQLGFATDVLVVVDIAELELHLKLHQLLLDRRIVSELFLDDLPDLPERPPDPSDGTSDGEEEEVGEEA